jgi:hypothetical protein
MAARRLVVAGATAAATLLAACGGRQHALPLDQSTTHLGTPIPHVLSDADTEYVIDALVTMGRYCETKRNPQGVGPAITSLLRVYRAHPNGNYAATGTPVSLRSVIQRERRQLERCGARGFARRLQLPAGRRSGPG